VIYPHRAGGAVRSRETPNRVGIEMAHLDGVVDHMSPSLAVSPALLLPSLSYEVDEEMVRPTAPTIRAPGDGGKHRPSKALPGWRTRAGLVRTAHDWLPGWCVGAQDPRTCLIHVCSLVLDQHLCYYYKAKPISSWETAPRIIVQTMNKNLLQC
jgi:hypothetical protein